MSVDLKEHIKKKITKTVGILLFLTFLLISILIFFWQKYEMKSDLIKNGEHLASILSAISRVIINEDRIPLLETVISMAESSPSIAFCEVYNARKEPYIQIDAFKKKAERLPLKQYAGKNIHVLTHPILLKKFSIGYVEVGIKFDPLLKDTIDRTLMPIGILFIIFLVVWVILKYFLDQNVSHPVNELLGFSQALSKNEPFQTLIKGRKDEIGRIAQNISEIYTRMRQFYTSLEISAEDRMIETGKIKERLQTEIVERKRAQEKLSFSEKNSETANIYRDTLMANMSHEIRTPLNAILGYTQILLLKKELDDDVKKALDTIEKSGNHLLGLINDILDLSKIEAGRVDLKIVPFDLVGLINNISTMFQLRCSQKKLSWKVMGFEKKVLIPVQGDEGKLRQVLINLLGNAVKFTRAGGIVLKISTLESHNYRFEVMDTGSGMKIEEQEAIFQPFSQTKSGSKLGGTGLGLSISKKYIKLMDGSLELESEPGIGSRFFFKIKLEPVSVDILPSEGVSKKIKAIADNRQVHALIADDESQNRSFLCKILSDAGIFVFEAGNGKEAVAKCRAHEPDIIFMDRYMPVLDGVDAIKQIRQYYPSDHIKIVMITAASLEREKSGYKLIGCDDIIIKPFRVEEVFECMARLLRLEYDYDEMDESGSKKEPFSIDKYKGFKMPEEMSRKIKEAVEFCKISELKSQIHELGKLGKKGSSLSNIFVSYVDSYQLDEIKKIVERLDSESA